MGLAVKTAASATPVSRTEFKAHASIEIADDDDMIDDIIESATNEVERYLWRQLVTATFTLTLDAFPLDDFIDLPRPPLATVTHVKYYDTANVLQTFSTDSWDPDITCEAGRIYVDRSVGWPSTYYRRNAVTIEYTAGYGAATAVPMAIKTAILMLCSHRYQHREPIAGGFSISEIPMTVQRILELYKFRGELNINRQALTPAV